jgi:hypothetical protein
VQDSLQSSGTQGICYRINTGDIFTLRVDFTTYGVLTQNKAGRCSRPLFTPRRTPTQLEALLHSKKYPQTIRGPSSLQEELPHNSRPFFTPERLPVCSRPLIKEQSACKTSHVNTDIKETILTAKEQQHQSSFSSYVYVKTNILNKANLTFRSTLALN